MSSLYALWVIDVVINIATLCAHATGMYAIITHGQSSNQTFILFNLSATEFMQSLRNMVNNVVRLVKYRDGYHEICYDILMNIHPYVYEEINSFSYLTPAVQLVLLMLVLTLDRLICSLNPLKYLIRFRIHAVRRIIIACWIFSITLGIVYAIMPKLKHILIFLFTVIGWIYFVFAIVSYIIIVKKIRRPSRECRESHQNHLQHRNGMIRKCYMVPGLIILSFFILYGIPFLLINFVVNRSHTGMNDLILNAGLVISMDLGLMSDAFIYIVLTPHYRKTISVKFFSCVDWAKQKIDEDDFKSLSGKSINRRITVEGIIAFITEETTL